LTPKNRSGNQVRAHVGSYRGFDDCGGCDKVQRPTTRKFGEALVNLPQIGGKEKKGMRTSRGRSGDLRWVYLCQKGRCQSAIVWEFKERQWHRRKKLEKKEGARNPARNTRRTRASRNWSDRKKERFI